MAPGNYNLVPVFHATHRKCTAPPLKTFWSLQSSLGMPSKPGSGWADEHIRWACSTSPLKFFKARLRSARRRLRSTEKRFSSQNFRELFQGVGVHCKLQVWQHYCTVQWDRRCFCSAGERPAVHRYQSPCCIRSPSAVHCRGESYAKVSHVGGRGDLLIDGERRWRHEHFLGLF